MFVSSTCYDLHEIRLQLRQFISDFGFEPVMSEFEDIFYNYDLHVQESCLEEIPKCHFFILIVGNNYGSLFHLDKHKTTPDSVTLREFRRALEIKIFKHTCINKYVDYDYKNYKRALDKSILEHFRTVIVADDDVERTKAKIKDKFDSSYPFPHESYRYIFYFLDIIYDLKENNGIHLFETFNDIKLGLKRQWAGLMHEALTKKERANTSSISLLDLKVEQLDKKISQLLEARTIEGGNKMSIDLSSILQNSLSTQLEEFKSKFDSLLDDICMYTDTDNWGNQYYNNRVTFKEPVTNEISRKWLDHLEEILQSYKWSKRINVQILFNNYSLGDYDRSYSEVNYQTIFDLFSLYNSLSDEDKTKFTNTVTARFNKCVYARTEVNSKDDLPF